MTTLLENPVPLILFGICAEAVLGILLVRTGRGVLLWAMAGVLAVVLAGVGLERLLVTEVEEVETALFEAAAALEANQQEKVLQYVDPAAISTQNLVRWALQQVRFSRVKITHLEVTNINRLTSPPTADVELNVTVWFEGRGGNIPRGTRPGKFSMQLQRQNDRWVVCGHDWKDDPRGR